MKRLAMAAAVAAAVAGCAPQPERQEGGKGPAVGYMLDISRDKVPTMETLYRIVDILAQLGYNQFQLYAEHTFAYKGHEQAWGDSSPMTAEEIRALDAYCAERGIELVPNQNSFGHLEKWFRRPKYRPLAEAPYGGVYTPWKVCMPMPRALCATDPKSFEFVGSLYDELLPNFRSKLLNVGCDEVWELVSNGKGRSWAAVTNTSPERVWIDYFRGICDLAAKHGSTVMYWDDMVVRKHPELIPEIPANTIALDWGYEVGHSHSYEADCAFLAKEKRPFYVCPGTCTWNAMSGRHYNMKTNVQEAVRAGLKHGAAGYLMTDWGNGGTCQPWITALPALIYMAHAVKDEWLTDGQIAAEVDRIAGAKCGKALIRYQNLYLLDGNPEIFNRTALYQMLEAGAAWRTPKKGMKDEDLKAVFAEWRAAKGDLDLTGAPAWVKDGFATMDLLYEALELRWKGEHDRVRREFPERFRKLWLAYNRPGGLDASVKTNFKGSHVAEVLFSFDTEDYTCPKNADGIMEIIKILDEEGVTGHFQIVGELALKLAEWKRFDVIAALKNHVIGSHTRYHSPHPNILESSDGADYAAAYRRIRALEEAAAEILRRTFGIRRVWSSCPPGNSNSYVAGRVYADLGIVWDAGPGYMPLEGPDIWFAGQRRIPYSYNLENLQKGARRPDKWPEDKDRILDRLAAYSRFFVYCHPNKVYSTEFWDAINYRGGNHAKWGKWKQPKARPDGEVKEYLAAIRGMVRAIKADPRFVITTLPEIEAKQKPRVAISRKDMPRIKAELNREFGPVRKPASWCVSDVFSACVAMLRGEDSFLPDNAYGFLEKPVGVDAAISVSRAEMVEAARKMDVSGFLPSTVEVGGRTIGPADFLFAALELLTTSKDSVKVDPRDQLGPYTIMPKLEKLGFRGTWLHCPPPEYGDTHTSDRLRWQLWTLRYE